MLLQASWPSPWHKLRSTPQQRQDSWALLQASVHSKQHAQMAPVAAMVLKVVHDADPQSSVSLMARLRDSLAVNLSDSGATSGVSRANRGKIMAGDKGPP